MTTSKISGLLALSASEYSKKRVAPRRQRFKARNVNLSALDEDWDRQRGAAVRIMAVILREDSESLFEKVSGSPSTTATFEDAADWLSREASLLRKTAKRLDLAVSRLSAAIGRYRESVSDDHQPGAGESLVGRQLIHEAAETGGCTPAARRASPSPDRGVMTMVKQNTKIQAVPRTLPPFSSVSVRCETFWDHIHIKYTGAIRDLIECGAIDPSMAVSARKGIRRVDSHGDGFRQKPLADRRLHVERSISDIDRALGLPGVYLDQESEIAQLLAKPGQVIYEQRGCWHIWFGAKESLAREGLGIACGTVRPGLRGFLRLSWCEDYPNDPRPLSARRTEAVNKARSDISCECISTLLKGAMIMACNEVSSVVFRR